MWLYNNENTCKCILTVNTVVTIPLHRQNIQIIKLIGL